MVENFSVMLENISYIRENHTSLYLLFMFIIASIVTVKVFKKFIAFAITVIVFAYMYYSKVGL